MAAPGAADGDVAAPGARVWVPISETPAGAPPEDDDEALPFTLGVVQRRRPEDAAPPSPDMVLVSLVEGGDVSAKPVWVKPASLVPANPETLDGVDDVGALSHLNEPSLLRVVMARYAARSIYTRAGPVLVAINPFTKVAGLYDGATMRSYQSAAAVAAAAAERDGPALPPHLYQVAGAAYYDMAARGRSQSVVINGESGAGKTESAKIILSFFISAASAAGKGGGGGTTKVGEVLQAELDASNVLLEAFGNAKTTRNHNSSRFGKLLQLRFSPTGALIGGSISRFLLEKSRVVSPEANERSYHAPYQLASCCRARAGAPAAELASRLGLRGAGTYRYLSAGGCLLVDGMDDAAEFEATNAALAAIYDGGGGDAAAGSAEAVWAVVAAVLTLGDIQFCEPDEEEGKGGGGAGGRAAAALPLAGAPAGPPGSLALDGEGAEEALRLAARLLGCGDAELLTALTSRTISAGGEEMVICKKLPEARASRDALAKALYERLFDHIIFALNRSLAAVGQGRGRGAVAASSAGIGILDIFGSEIFATNGFEQLLINYANEKLQAHFTAAAITLLQAEYMREGLAVDRVEYTDNAATIALLEGKPLSVLAVLDDQCLQAGATDASLTAALHSSFDGHASYGAPRIGADSAFTINHFGGRVTYAVAGFLSKNKDALFAELPSTMRASASPFVAELFSEAAEQRRQQGPLGDGGADAAGKPAAANVNEGPARRVSHSRRAAAAAGGGGGGKKRATQFVSVGSQFRGSIASLVGTLGATQSHFVRCIKPNEVRGPFVLWPAVALAQLRCCAVLEAVRVSQAGFPTRIPFDELLSRYAMLRPRLPAAPGASGGGGGGGGAGKLRRRGTGERASAWMGGGGGGEEGGQGGQGSTAREEAAELLQLLQLAPDEYMLGKTVVFLRSGVLARCEAARARHLSKCFATVQARTRGRSARRNFHSVRSSAVLLQQTLRRRVKRREAARLAAEAAAAAAAAAEVPEDAELAGQAARLRAEVDALQAEAEPDWLSQAAIDVASVAGSVAGSARALSDDDSSIGDDEQLEELRAELSEAIQERDDFEEENYELQEKCGKYEEELDLLEEENAELRDALAVCQRDLSQAKEEQLALFLEVNELRARVAERDREMNQLLIVNSDMMMKLADEGFASPRDSKPSLKPAAVVRSAGSTFGQ